MVTMTMMHHFKLFVSAVLLVCCFLHNTDGLAVMSVDFGQEFMKVALVKPGVPMEVVLNRESQRKTATIVSMRDGDRFFGDPAMNTAVKFPAKAYWYLLSVVGKKIDHPHVKRYQQMFPFYTLKADPERGTVIFQHDDETSYSVEELIAMILERAKESVESFAEQTIKDIVITVPAYFNQAERRAVMRAAEMVDLHVLQLMNDNSAVALNYGVFRRKEFNATAQHFLFYDMGASSSTATIVTYQTVRMKDRGFVETNPQLTIRGVGFDAALGGLEFQLRLRDHLAKLFNAQKKTKNDVTKNQRSMAKLLKEAGRVKKVLSANNDHFAQVEGLLDDVDFRAKVTREEYEGLCTDLFERVAKPVKDALLYAGMHMDEISEVILMGGGTRVPKVQDTLREVTGRTELGKSINTDEAAAMGAVYQAAYLSKGYKVKRFGVKEAVIYPIQVEFEREVTNDDDTKSTKTIKRVIFGRMNPFPVSKVMKFNKNYDDFNFEVLYGDLDFLPEDERAGFGDQLLSKVALSGVGEMYEKHSAESDFKGVKAHFRMDESGLLHLDLVDSVFEKQPPSPDEKEEESTLSKLGNTISNLFGGGEEKKDEKKEEKPEEKTDQKEEKKPEEGAPKKETEPKSDDTEPKSDKTEPKSEKSESKEEKKSSEEEKAETKDDSVENEEPDEKPLGTSTNATNTAQNAAPKNKTDQSDSSKKEEKKEDAPKKNETKENATKTEDGKADANKTAEEKEKLKPKPIVIKEKLTATNTMMDLKEPTNASLAGSKKKVTDLRLKDKAKHDREKAINDLESYVFTMKDNLHQGNWEKCSTAEERTKLKAKLYEASEWIDDQGMDTLKSEYDTKLSTLKEEFKDIAFRVDQAKDRPRALEALKSMLNHSRFFLKSIKNLTIDEPIFTEVEVTTLSKLINETTAWEKKTLKEIKAAKSNEKPPVSIEDIAVKINALDREVKYLLNKAKYYKPKPKTEKKEDKNQTETNSTATNDTKTDGDEGLKIEVPGADTKTDESEKKDKESEKKDKDSQTKEEEEPLQLDGGDASGKKTDTTPETPKKDTTPTGDSKTSQTDSKPVEPPQTEAPPKAETKKHDPSDL